MYKFWVLVSQTYKSKIKSKGFVWSTLLTMIFLFAGVTVPNLIDKMNSNKELQSIAVVGSDEVTKDILENSLANISVQTADSSEEAKEWLNQKEVSGYLEMKNDENTLVTLDPVNSEDITSLSQALQMTKVQQVSNELDVSGSDLQNILSPINLDTTVLNDNQKSLSEKEKNAAENLAIGLLFLLYTFVTLYGTMIAMEIAKEKGSRIMEVIISSSSATTHFFGKLVGVFLISVTQLSIFGILGYFIITNFGSDMIKGFMIDTIQSVSSVVWVYAVIFALLGYLFYGVLAAFVGSLVSKVEDINHYMSPLSYILMIAFILSLLGVSTPSSLLVTVGSYIPFFAPMLMFIRISLLETSNLEIIASMLILITSVASLMWLCVRFYQGSVLIYSNQSILKSIKSAWKLAAEK
ncbi:ABC transporter permease [Rossellomorea aquimaris]|uniref:ABC-2 type transport system permease protein n=1 Tax=Rossellomorea aquimaris TaxID=189382 RepID=A0A366EJE7_9BACI|nr:ABC transporter permease [Rossellomorea aquimaris]RBP02478.1 ABC-2 type transport system permease protein [Rossellomorea aquimaris]